MVSDGLRRGASIAERDVLVTVRAAASLSEEERQRVDDADRRAFAGEDEGGDGYVWTPQCDWVVQVEVEGELASQVLIVGRVGTVGGLPVRLAGIGGVGTVPEWRGRGLAARALERAAAFMRDDMGADLGLLLCSEDMVPYYSRLGWQVAPGPVYFDQPSGKVAYGGVAMVLPCREQQVPAGTIDLCGLPW